MVIKERLIYCFGIRLQTNNKKIKLTFTDYHRDEIHFHWLWKQKKKQKRKKEKKPHKICVALLLFVHVTDHPSVSSAQSQLDFAGSFHFFQGKDFRMLFQRLPLRRPPETEMVPSSQATVSSMAIWGSKDTMGIFTLRISICADGIARTSLLSTFWV